MKKVFPDFRPFRDPATLQNLFRGDLPDEELRKQFFAGYYYLTSLFIEDGGDRILCADAAESLCEGLDSESLHAFLELLYQDLSPLMKTLPDDYVKGVNPPDVESASLVLLEDAIFAGQQAEALRELEKAIILADDTQNIFEKLLELAAMKPAAMPVMESLFSMFLESDHLLRDHYLYQACRYLSAEKPEFVPRSADAADFEAWFLKADADFYPVLMHLMRAAENARLWGGRIRAILPHSLQDMPLRKNTADAESRPADLPEPAELLKQDLKEGRLTRDRIRDLNTFRFLLRYLGESEQMQPLLAHYAETLQR